MSKTEVTAAELDAIFGAAPPAPSPTPVVQQAEGPISEVPTHPQAAPGPATKASDEPDPLLDKLPDLLRVVASDLGVQDAVVAAVRAFLAGGGRRG